MFRSISSQMFPSTALKRLAAAANGCILSAGMRLRSCIYSACMRIFGLASLHTVHAYVCMQVQIHGLVLISDRMYWSVAGLREKVCWSDVGSNKEVHCKLAGGVAQKAGPTGNQLRKPNPGTGALASRHLYFKVVRCPLLRPPELSNRLPEGSLNSVRSAVIRDREQGGYDGSMSQAGRSMPTCEATLRSHETISGRRVRCQMEAWWVVSPGPRQRRGKL